MVRLAKTPSGYRPTMSLQNAEAYGAPVVLEAGDRLRLRKELIQRFHEGCPTGKSYACETTFDVLCGVCDRPDVIWIRQPDGNRHTWDDASIFEWFEIVNSKP